MEKVWRACMQICTSPSSWNPLSSLSSLSLSLSPPSKSKSKSKSDYLYLPLLFSPLIIIAPRFCLMYKAASFGLLRTPLRSPPSSLFKPSASSRLSASLAASRSLGFARPLSVSSAPLTYTCGSGRRSSSLSARAWIGKKPAVGHRLHTNFASMGNLPLSFPLC